MNDNTADEIKRALVDVRALLESLGLLAGKGTFQRQAAGYLVRCFVHADRTPSCSVQLRHGVVLWNCHACGESGDALSMIAAVRGYSLRGDDFRQVLIAGAELAGLHSLVAELESGETTTPRPAPAPRAEPEPEPERDYPPIAEVESILDACRPCTGDPEVSAWLTSRGLSPDHVDGAEVVGALPPKAKAPRWASYQGRPWAETGHRLIVPMFDATGLLRSVRACRVVDGDSPKRLPPGGHRASGIVMACVLGRAMLRGDFAPQRVVVSEGEPDWLLWATRPGIAAHARIGIVSGSWTPELAARIPNGATVIVRTDNDPAGDRYAQAIADTMGRRCELLRSVA